MGSCLNGLDVEALQETCDQIKRDPALAKSQFRIHNTWENGGHNTVRIKGFYTAGKEQDRHVPFEFDADEPPALLGQDQGANPVEYLLSALSGCMTTSIIYHAAARGIKIEALSSDFRGDIDLQGFLNLSTDVPKGYQQIDAVFHVKTEAPIEELEPLYHFSPVYAMLSKAIPINVTFVKD